MGLPPVPAGTDVHHERHPERLDALHALADTVRRSGGLLLGHLEDELVVHLEDHPGSEPGLFLCRRHLKVIRNALESLRSGEAIVGGEEGNPDTVLAYEAT